jgi:flagellar basal-body rod modification protein FlgD
MQPFASPPASRSSGASSGAASNALSETASQKVGKDGFLKILVTQLKNQNPTDPMKGRDFASQLAQFSSVEQLTGISDQLEQQKTSDRALTQSINSGVATDLIGRTVEASGGEFTWAGEGTMTLGADLPSGASNVTMTVRDAAGNAVHTRTLDDVPAGPQEISWDGTTDADAPAPAGNYSVQIEATDAQGDPVEARPYVAGRVDRVAFGKDGTRLWVGGAKLPMSRVRSVAAP